MKFRAPYVPFTTNLEGWEYPWLGLRSLPQALPARMNSVPPERNKFRAPYVPFTIS